MKDIFRPKIIDTLKGYSRKDFYRDAIAGIVVGIVALPLAIAFAIASGVSPEKGLITAIIAGFLVSAFGGSRVQIGGPTGAYIVIVYGIVLEYGINGLIIATFLAGFMLIIMGLARLGSVIKYIPHSLIIGFTSGIAVIIFSSQIKDFLGLEMGDVPADFIEKWQAFIQNIQSVNPYAAAIAVFTILIIILFPYISKKIPGSLIAILFATVAVHLFNLPVETIGSRFGVVTSSIPMPVVPQVDYAIIRDMIQPAFAIAILGAIESLLSAVVADGMISGRHRSNTELIGQGIANVGSSLFGGIPATGAIARTATNVKNGGRTPIAGIIHALVLLFILIFLGKWASLIPLSCLAGVLVVISYNMSEHRNFRSILKGPRGDIVVMLTTFFLTVLVDLTLAIQVGLILAGFSFISKMIQTSSVKIIDRDIPEDEELIEKSIELPEAVDIFEITGPLFFGAAYKVTEAIRLHKMLGKCPEILIIRMRYVPIIDATGISSFKQLIKELDDQGTKVIIAELVSDQVRKELQEARILFMIGKGNVFIDLESAIARAKVLIDMKK